ncbi:hypothetical protein [Caballeronia novacaledonica]|uniref:Uncharacterized protein n=1 Tax=Caballeronia novacaledonica TaxID=1544861 RepID=A0AA37IG70_9BURK|nr:hypothetical protein [Caballeronia novacaledonica]GJH28149.1 hypothetical protein CBA19CS42_26555 [Caballeronia novacaledonica]
MTNIDQSCAAIQRIADSLLQSPGVAIAPLPKLPRGRTAARTMARDAAVGSAGGGPLMPHAGAPAPTREEVLRSVRPHHWHEPSPIR